MEEDGLDHVVYVVHLEVWVEEEDGLDHVVCVVHL